MNFTNCTNFNVSAEEYLEHLQDEANMTIIPAVIMMSILAIIGLIGNTLVLIVYSKKFTLSPTKVLIMTIACFDLIANVGAIPTDVYYVFHSWNFTNSALCRTKVFLATFSTLGGAISLAVVAVVRYRKICHAHGWQVTTKQAQIISCATAVISLLLCIPYIVISNIGTRKTACLDVKGYGCYIDDSYLRTLWPVINQIMLIFLHLFLSCLLVVLYILVGVTAWRLSRKLILVGKGSKSKSKTKSLNRRSMVDTESKRFHGQSRSTGLNRQGLQVDVQESTTICASKGKVKTQLCSVKPRKTRACEHDSPVPISVNTSTSTDDTGTTETSRGTNSETISLQVTSSEEISHNAENSKVNSPDLKDLTTNKGSSPINIVPSTNIIEHQFASHTHLSRTEALDKLEITGQVSRLKNAHDSNDDEKYEQNKLVTISTPNPENGNTCKNQENCELHTNSNIREITTKQKSKSYSLDVNGKATRTKMLSRMTAMLIIISVIYVLSYIPLFVISIISYRQPGVMEKLNPAGLSVTKVFVRLYFVNSAANPIIYSLCCIKFRQACIRLFTFNTRTRL
ncbi:hypothetical protein BsWGS_14059 [Bradybaena similaris]